MINWTFGIVTSAKSSGHVANQIISIKSLGIKEFEILVIGGQEIIDKSVRHIPIDETKPENTITHKKNLIAKFAKYENLVICHDYIGFHEDWAAGFEIFGNDWDVCITRVEDLKGRRFYDWTSWDSPKYERYAAIPYDDLSQTKYQFIPGAYWIAKRSFMLMNPLNEKLNWGESEDVEWSLRIRESNFKLNPFSKAIHLKKHRGYKFFRSIYNGGIQIFPRKDYKNWL